MTPTPMDAFYQAARPAVLGAVALFCATRGHAPTATQVCEDLSEFPTSMVLRALGELEAEGYLEMGSHGGDTWWRPGSLVKEVCLND